MMICGIIMCVKFFKFLVEYCWIFVYVIWKVIKKIRNDIDSFDNVYYDYNNYDNNSDDNGFEDKGDNDDDEEIMWSNEIR